MENFVPLTENEKDTLFKVADIIKAEKHIPCTACGYCVKGCPKGIKIPQLFKAYNERRAYDECKASDCIKCKQCEAVCPQHLDITGLLEVVAEELE